MIQAETEHHNVNINKPTVLQELMNKTNTSSIVGILGNRKQISKTVAFNLEAFYYLQ